MRCKCSWFDTVTEGKGARIAAGHDVAARLILNRDAIDLMKTRID
jgi:hypothetical protein